MKIAMWSGPRNLSTAMMYSFGARADCAVVDEPFYAAYLHKTGLEHPMREQVLASQPVDPQQVVAGIMGPNPGGLPHCYQKHMTQHMVNGMPLSWMSDVVNVFLIRHPARVMASFSAKYEAATLEDIGFVQQANVFDRALALGQTPVVVDSADIRADPTGMLQRLCDAIGLSWDPAMLQWPTGGRAEDGIWAKHWYGAVHNSTGFAGSEGDLPNVSGLAGEIVAQALPSYERLKARAISAD